MQEAGDDRNCSYHLK